MSTLDKIQELIRFEKLPSGKFAYKNLTNDFYDGELTQGEMLILATEIKALALGAVTDAFVEARATE